MNNKFKFKFTPLKLLKDASTQDFFASNSTVSVNKSNKQVHLFLDPNIAIALNYIPKFPRVWPYFPLSLIILPLRARYPRNPLRSSRSPCPPRFLSLWTSISLSVSHRNQPYHEIFTLQPFPPHPFADHLICMLFACFREKQSG